MKTWQIERINQILKMYYLHTWWTFSFQQKNNNYIIILWKLTTISTSSRTVDPSPAFICSDTSIFARRAIAWAVRNSIWAECRWRSWGWVLANNKLTAALWVRHLLTSWWECSVLFASRDKFQRHSRDIFTKAQTKNVIRSGIKVDILKTQ